MKRQPSANSGLLPMRETFRALRYRFRQNARLIRRVTKSFRTKVSFPDTAEKRFVNLVKDADTFASNIARKLLNGSAADILVATSSLQTSDDEKLASVAYSALNFIVNCMGIKDAYVSEAAALKALAKQGDRTARRQSETAATLMMVLLDEKVLSYPAHSDDNAPAKSYSEAVPVFALLLWLQSERDDPYANEVFSAATNLSIALAADVVKFATARDVVQLARLFEEFSTHV